LWREILFLGLFGAAVFVLTARKMRQKLV